jgi:hypothetical protein
MGIEIQDDERSGIFVARVRGRMTVIDQAAAVAAARAAIAKRQRLKMLIVLEEFDGWASAEEWSDENFRLDRDEGVERIAIVCEPRWREQLSLFIGEAFRRMPIEYFASDEAARVWLAA